jgi:uncharacterized membrane protein SirB2
VPEPAAVRAFGWREVLIVGAVIVVAVLGLSVITSILPSSAQWFVFQSPLLIVIIVVGTLVVLASLLRRPPAR